MPIIGLTDNSANDSRILGRIEIRVFKGDRKPANGYGFGKDLGNELRISTQSVIAKSVLKQAKIYGEPNKNGDFFTGKINIYLAFDEVHRTFASEMKSYSASGLELVCDRQTISKKCVPTSDAKGNVYRPIVDVHENCPMAGKGLSGDCPNKCQKEGKFYFYIREMLDKDVMMPVCLTTHSFEDLVYLTDMLGELSRTIGSLTQSPFPAYQYRHKIPFILSRSEVKIKRPILDKETKTRTGTKSDGTTWALTLQVDPDWMELHRKWQQIREMEARKMLVSQATIMGLLSGDTSTAIDVEVVSESTVNALPSKEDAAALRMERMRDRIAELARKYQELTGESIRLPDLNAMDEAQLKNYGQSLRAQVDDAQSIIPEVIESDRGLMAQVVED